MIKYPVRGCGAFSAEKSFSSFHSGRIPHNFDARMRTNLTEVSEWLSR